MPRENLKWENHYNQKSVIAKKWRKTWNVTQKTAAKNPSPNFRMRLYDEENSVKAMKELLKCGANLSQIELDYDPRSKETE